MKTRKEVWLSAKAEVKRLENVVDAAEARRMAAVKRGDGVAVAEAFGEQERAIWALPIARHAEASAYRAMQEEERSRHLAAFVRKPERPRPDRGAAAKAQQKAQWA